MVTPAKSHEDFYSSWRISRDYDDVLACCICTRARQTEAMVRNSVWESLLVHTGEKNSALREKSERRDPQLISANAIPSLSLSPILFFLCFLFHASAPSPSSPSVSSSSSSSSLSLFYFSSHLRSLLYFFHIYYIYDRQLKTDTNTMKKRRRRNERSNSHLLSLGSRWVA